VFDNHQGGAAPFTPEANALEEPQDHQKNRGPDSDLLVGRKAPDGECSQCHDHHGDHQHDLATHPIAEMAEYGSADRACDKPD
jgi:hypothetical protein